MTKDHKKFIKSTILIGACALLSRILGLLRATLLAYRFGASESEGLTDCYSAAFKLPDIIFNLVAFGVISIVLIPYFSGFIKKNELDKLKKACSSFFNFFLVFVSFFIILGFFFAPFFVKNFLVKGWTEININTKRITMPLEKFKDVDISNLKEIQIIFNKKDLNTRNYKTYGTLFLDNIGIERKIKGINKKQIIILSDFEDSGKNSIKYNAISNENMGLYRTSQINYKNEKNNLLRILYTLNDEAPVGKISLKLKHMTDLRRYENLSFQVKTDVNTRKTLFNIALIDNNEKKFVLSSNDFLTTEKNINLTVLMTRILFLQVLFMTLSGIFGSYLNAVEKFRAYAFALLSYNMGIIFGIIVLSPFLSIQGVAWGAVIGSFIHFIIQASGSIHNGFRYHFTFPKFNKEIRELLLIAIPRIIAISGEQLVKFFIVYIASFLFIGSIFIFENAENFSMVPFGMIAVSISTTAFPIFSKLFISKEYTKLLDTLVEKLRNLIFFMLPVTIMMIVFRQEIIEILLAWGKFSQYDVLFTSNTLAFYMIGIPFFSITIILAKFYYAQKRSFLPMVITLISMGVTIAGCYYFAGILKVSGLSLGRSMGYIVQAVLLVFFMFIINKKEKIFNSFPKAIMNDIFKIFIPSVLMLILGFFLQKYINFTDIIKLNAFLKLVIFGISLTILYLGISYLLKIPEVNGLIKTVRTKLKL